MSFLKRKPDRELGHLTRKRDQLEARLADARTALDRAHEARNRALLEGDLDDSLIGEHNSRCRSADDHIIGIEHALDELQHKIDQVEAAVAADRARVEREAASGEMLAQVALVRDAVAQFRTSAAHLVEALRPMAARDWDDVACDGESALLI
jgi:chromosome segregation ATPase